MPADEFYQKEDPFKVKDNMEEISKRALINGLIEKWQWVRGLDIGCGEGYFTPKGFFGIDISATAIQRARTKHHNFYVHDITEKPYGLCWDCIIMREVLYYIKPKLWENVAKNIYTMLREGGQFIISVGQYFTEADIKKIFSKINFNQVYKLPSEKYEYNLIMSGHYTHKVDKCSR